MPNLTRPLLQAQANPRSWVVGELLGSEKHKGMEVVRVSLALVCDLSSVFNLVYREPELELRG